MNMNTKKCNKCSIEYTGDKTPPTSVLDMTLNYPMVILQ